eukprot:NODE_673_length_1993_cov_25.812757_g622_i0.p1 GENE.NODE_673_length_1993_cov_25.812757_g622_i0~~NODE_673_length_1993_cov_25.812757_g622_i0.p1  ORF type:complete len:518 (-),score=101.74 NODE_673_length_1993_cov_25.812757_g622_i0:438-1904(-)
MPRLLCLGYGSVARCTLAIVCTWKGGELRKKLNLSTIEVLAKELTAEDQAQLEAWGIKSTLAELTSKTYDGILRPLLTKETLVINLTTSVNSLDIHRLTQAMGAMCLDSSSSEMWPEQESGAAELGEEGSNYMCREEYMATSRALPKGSPTSLTCMGANPGLVTFFVKRALAHLYAEYTKGAGDVQRDGGFAKVAQTLGLRVVHIAERDTQVPVTPRKPNEEFTNTWSVDGFILEGCLQPADLGWGTHEKSLPPHGHHYSKGCGASIRIARPSCDVHCLTWVPTFGEQVGMVVTHYESTSIADFLTLRNAEGEAVYRPTVHYAYHPCEEAILSMEEIKKNGWNPDTHRVHHVYAPEEIQDGGCDELGVLLMMNKDFGSVWYGSTIYNEEAKAIAPNTQATTIQVAAGVIAGALWMIEHPNEGMVEPENILDYEKALREVEPFLGKMHYGRSSWTPRGGDPTSEDTWQFERFLLDGRGFDATCKRVGCS